MASTFYLIRKHHTNDATVLPHSRIPRGNTLLRCKKPAHVHTPRQALQNNLDPLQEKARREKVEKKMAVMLSLPLTRMLLTPFQMDNASIPTR
jgi:hypothetical protein